MTRRGMRVGLAAMLGLLGGGLRPAAAAITDSARKVVSLTFDDGRASQSVLGAVLSSHRMHGTFYIITGAVHSGAVHPESLTWAQIDTLARDGNEVGGHTRTHPDLPTLDRAGQVAEVCGSRHDLLAHGFRPLSFAYPFGDLDSSVEGVVQHCGYANGRGAWGGVERIPPDDRYALRTLPSVTDSDTVAALEGDITTAPPGAWIQYVFHDIGDPYPGGDQYRITTAHLITFLDWLARQRDAGTVVVKTVGQVAH
jgi:peptidoglycan/xylan/chitin deacetylase (PgdA/CDA1 family)